jgi:hypothetical protein
MDTMVQLREIEKNLDRIYGKEKVNQTTDSARSYSTNLRVAIRSSL